MSQVFGPTYAGAYDSLYHDKDYAAEVDVAEQVFNTYAKRPVHRVLDLGCGTGRHAAILTERGYQVVGVDRSASMLEAARARVPSANFVQADLTSLEMDDRFDAVLLFFAVLGYQTGNADVRATLDVARRHLLPGGILFADVWYGPAVLTERPGDRVRVVDIPPHGQLIRVASSELDLRAHVCQVRYRMWRLDDGRVLDHTSENHRMRFFFPMELELFLEDAGFELVCLGAFPKLDESPTPSTWNVALVARAA